MELEKVQYTNKSSELIRTYETRVKELEKLSQENLEKVNKC
jgi:hypothetical protein